MEELSDATSKKNLFVVVVLTDDIEKQEMISKVNNYLKSFNQEIEKDNLVIIFSPIYKIMVNSKKVRVKQFDESAFNASFNLCVEIDGFGFSNASLREKCYNYVTKNNLTIVKIK